jgi:hypothetical protein
MIDPYKYLSLYCLKNIIGLRPKLGNTYYHIIYIQTEFSADLAMYWCPVCHFRCKEFNPLEVWIWNQNIAIYTIVGTSSHIIIKTSNQNTCISFNEAARAAITFPQFSV